MYLQHTYIHAYTNIQTYRQTDIQTDIHTYILIDWLTDLLSYFLTFFLTYITYIHTHLHLHLHIHIHIYIYTYIHMHIHIHLHIHKNIHIHIHIHTIFCSNIPIYSFVSHDIPDWSWAFAPRWRDLPWSQGEEQSACWGTTAPGQLCWPRRGGIAEHGADTLSVWCKGYQKRIRIDTLSLVHLVVWLLIDAIVWSWARWLFSLRLAVFGRQAAEVPANVLNHPMFSTHAWLGPEEA